MPLGTEYLILKQPNESDVGTVSAHQFQRGIEIKNLSFSYDGEIEVLKDVSLKVNKGEKVAFVGLSGSGKSTIINLLLGLYPTRDGAISIDQKPIQDLKLSALGVYFLVGESGYLFYLMTPF